MYNRKVKVSRESFLIILFSFESDFTVLNRLFQLSWFKVEAGQLFRTLLWNGIHCITNRAWGSDEERVTSGLTRWESQLLIHLADTILEWYRTREKCFSLNLSFLFSQEYLVLFQYLYICWIPKNSFKKNCILISSLFFKLQHIRIIVSVSNFEEPQTKSQF